VLTEAVKLVDCRPGATGSPELRLEIGMDVRAPDPDLPSTELVDTEIEDKPPVPDLPTTESSVTARRVGTPEE
jgi:hypothetical protein